MDNMKQYRHAELDMNATRRWMLYVAAYTCILGLPLLLAPNLMIPYLGFKPTEEPWVRFAGMFLLALTYLSIAIYRSHSRKMLFASIIMRSWFFGVVLTMALAGHPRGLYLIAGIILIGVIGSSWSYYNEIRSA